MADFDDLLGAAMAPGEDAAVDEPEAAGAAPDAAADPTPETAEERLYAGKYKTVDDLERSYLEAQRLISQGAHKQPEPVYEEPEQDEPASMFESLGIHEPLGGEPLSPGELEQWATDSPRDAALWAMSRQGLRPDLRDAVVRHWVNTDPDGFTDWKMEQRFGEFQSQLQQTLAPQMAFVQQQQTQLFAQTLAANVQGWDDAVDAEGKVVTPGIGRDVLAAIQANPQGIPPQVWQQGMVAVAQFIDQWYGNALRYEAYRKQQAAMAQHGEAPAPAAPRAARATSENSSGPASAGGGAVSEDDIKESILASVREQAGVARL